MILELTFILLMSLYIYHYWATNYWKRMNVFTVPGEFIFGNTRKLLMSKENTKDFFNDLYDKYKDKKLVGFYNFYEPLLMVTDPDLIKQIMISDFNSFSDQIKTIDKRLDPLLYLNPFFTKGLQEWKAMRAIHTPMLTPLRLKEFTPNIVKIGKIMIDYIAGKSSTPIKVGDLTKYFTIDVISATLFGLEPSAFTDPDNPFLRSAYPTVFSDDIEKAFLFANFLPKINSIFSYRIISSSGVDFFRQLVQTMVKSRKGAEPTRNDYIDNLLRIDKKRKEEGKKELTYTEMANHLMTAYVDGVESSSTILSFLLLVLRNQPEIQERLREEIFAVGNEPEDFTYEKVHSIAYLTMVLKETLRIHPLTVCHTRQCTKTKVFGDRTIEKGIRLYIPHQCIISDPEYFPNPEIFDPERFSEDSESSVAKGTFLPFGEGPRICLGMKYALLQIKLMVVFVLLKFRMSPADEDQVGKNVESSVELANILTPSREETVIFQPL